MSGAPQIADNESDTPLGEVAIRQNGQEHAVEADAVDGQVYVDLDGEKPVATLPPEFAVEYHDPEDVVADGGVPVSRTEVQMRGFGLEESHAFMALLLSAILFVGAGTLMFGSSGQGAAGLAMAAAGVLSGYVGGASYWSGRSR